MISSTEPVSPGSSDLVVAYPLQAYGRLETLLAIPFTVSYSFARDPFLPLH